MSIIKHVTLQKIVAHDYRYDPRSNKHQADSVMSQVQYVAALMKRSRPSLLAVSRERHTDEQIIKQTKRQME